MLWGRSRGRGAVEEVFDAEETRFEEGDGGQRRLVQGVLHGGRMRP